MGGINLTTEIKPIPAPEGGVSLLDWRNFDFADREALVTALRGTEQLARMLATVRLYLIAGAMERGGHEWIAMRELIVEATGTSVIDADEWILVASRLGFERLRAAMEDMDNRRGHVLSFAQWKAVAMAGDSEHRQQLYQLATDHGVPAYELEAAAQGMALEEYRIKRLLDQLAKILKRLADTNVERERVIAVLAEYGYAQKRITNPR